MNRGPRARAERGVYSGVLWVRPKCKSQQRGQNRRGVCASAYERSVSK